MKTLESLWSDLFRPLSSFGYTEGQGTTRLSWSPAFLAAQDFLQHYADLESEKKTSGGDKYSKLAGNTIIFAISSFSSKLLTLLS